MSALNNQYYSFLNAKNNKKNRQDQKLLIKKISHGSVIMDLIEKATPLLPAIYPTIFEFTNYVCTTIDYLIEEAWDRVVVTAYEKICSDVSKQLNENVEIFNQWKSDTDAMMNEELANSKLRKFLPLVILLDLPY
jgi:hypothetical protein